jgi:hypothetical protein
MTIPIIPSRIHGMIDYAVGVLLIFAPQFLGLQGGWESRIFVLSGVAALLYSLLTRYEYGLIKILPFRGHLLLDVVHAAVLTSSPWLLGFAERVWVPHLLAGLLEFSVIAFSQRYAPVHEPIPIRPPSR